MITISDEAKDYIKQNGSILKLIAFNKMSLCCGRIALEPSLSLGKPKDAENYILEKINEIDVYIPKNFHSPNPFRIELKKILAFKSLKIADWKLI
jgi:hypothetical protein